MKNHKRNKLVKLYCFLPPSIFKMFLFTFIYCCLMNNVNSQSYIQGFNSFNGLIHDGDWVVQNKSTPKGTVDWMQGNPIVFDSYNGEKRSFAAVNYNSTSTFGENNTINNWLLTPTRVFRNGDVFIFYTRKQTTNNTPDRLEIRFSKNGASVNGDQRK